jgi:hypothetical protein
MLQLATLRLLGSRKKNDCPSLDFMDRLPNAPRQRGPTWSTAFCVALLLSCSLSGFAPFGKAAAPPESSSGSSGPVALQFTISDFDGDSLPDLASVQTAQSGFDNTRYFVDFRLTTGLRLTIRVTAPAGGLQLTSRDVNGDSYPDVIVTTFLTNQPVAVLLNDGRGNFTQSDPSAFPGAFATAENSRICKPDAVKDAAAAIFSGYLPGECEECERTPSPQVVAGRSVTGVFHFAAPSNGNSFFGRAPPYVALH